MKVLSKINKILLFPFIYLFHKNIFIGFIQKKFIKKFRYKEFIFKLNIKNIPLSVYSSFFFKTYEINDRIIVEKFINTNNKCIIIGGGIGFISVISYHLSKSRIVVLEINQSIIKNLDDNLSINNCDYLLLNKNLVFENNIKNTTFYFNQNFLESSVFNINNQIEYVENINFKNIPNYKNYNTLIIDGEGIEKFIISNLEKLENIKYIIFELHNHILTNEDNKLIFKILNANGFTKKFEFLSSFYYSRI